jgi:hypothetical protein
MEAAVACAAKLCLQAEELEGRQLFREAMAEYREALRSDPSNPKLTEAIGRVGKQIADLESQAASAENQLDTGRFRLALKTADSALSATPNDSALAGLRLRAAAAVWQVRLRSIAGLALAGGLATVCVLAGGKLCEVAGPDHALVLAYLLNVVVFPFSVLAFGIRSGLVPADMPFLMGIFGVLGGLALGGVMMAGFHAAAAALFPHWPRGFAGGCAYAFPVSVLGGIILFSRLRRVWVRRGLPGADEAAMALPVE